MDKEYSSGSKIKSNRTQRALSLVSLASSLAGNALAQSVNKISHGQRPDLKNILITPDNAKRVTDKLMQLRGAALKVGQLISMDAGEFVPEELAVILARLRDNVEPIPFSQLIQCLEKEWGENWSNKFKQFSFTPIAAASIGQVHKANTIDNHKIVLKIQYPNVDKAIDSDVDNVATILNLTGLIPKESNIKSLLNETKNQLRLETDYLHEASCIDYYREELKELDDFVVPKVYYQFTTKSILAMSYHSGCKLDELSDCSQEEKNRIATQLIRLLLKEMFELKRVQTDPNMANFLYDKELGKIILLDFGAVRKLPEHVSNAYLKLMTASMHNDSRSVNDACEQIGFFQKNISESQRDMVVNLFIKACEPLRHDHPYDFGNSKLATQISQNATNFSFKKDQWHTPPADALFLHRKIAGIYLIAAKLNATVDVASIFRKYID